MNNPEHLYELSNYGKFVLNKIINAFDETKDFNLYELVRESVSNKYILASQNVLIMETYFMIKDYLVFNMLVIEKKEMCSYILTGKGAQLKRCGSLEKYEYLEFNQNGKSMLHRFFPRNKNSATLYTTKS